MKSIILWLARAAGIALFLGAGLPAASQARDYPVKPVKIVVAGPPGGGTDFLARLLADKLAKELGESVIVENRPGASGLIGTKYVKQASADGYTLIMGHSATHGILPLIHSEQTYDPINDFTPISLIATAPEILVVPASSPLKSFADLAAKARQKPGMLTYGTPGIGQPQHILTLRVMQLAGIKMLHIPYNGSGPAITDLLGGRLTAMFATPAAVMPFIKASQMRALAISSKNRSKLLANVPTLEEAGLKGLYQVDWFGLFGPAHMRASTLATLSKATMKAMEDDAVRSKIAASYVEPEGTKPEQFAGFQAAEVAKFKEIVKETGITIN